MNVCYNLLSFGIVEILTHHTNCDSRITYDELINSISKDYNLVPSKNTLKRTLKALNATGKVSIQGIGSRKGIWLETNISAMMVEAIFAHIVTLDYLDADTIGQIRSILFRLRHKGPFQGLEKTTPRSARERQKNFWDNLELIYVAMNTKVQLGFTYNDLNLKGCLSPRCNNEHPDGVRIVSVYKFFCKNGFYYIVGKDYKDNIIRNYRIDRMSNLFYNGKKAEHISNIEGYEDKDKLCLLDYLEVNYKMFSDKIVKCKFEIKVKDQKRLPYFIGIVWDELGEHNLHMYMTDSGIIQFTAILPTKGAILFTQQFGDFVRLVAPAELCDQMRKYSEDLWKDYH